MPTLFDLLTDEVVDDLAQRDEEISLSLCGEFVTVV